MTRILFAIAALTLLLQATPASAQDRWAVEFHGNGGIATQDADRDTHENGFGLGASVRYRFMPHLSAYAGWDWNLFQALDAIAGPDMELEETGYVAGLRFEHPVFGRTTTLGWVRAGAMYNHIELENDDNDMIIDSGHGLGWEAAGGLAFDRGRWSIAPGLRYRSLSRDLDIGTATMPVELQAVAFELGIVRRF